MTASRQNLEIVRGLYPRWNAGDPAFDRYASDVEWDLSHWAPDLGEPAHGHDEVRRLFARFLGVWDEVHLEPGEFIDCGDNIVVCVTVQTRGRGSGVPVTLELAHLFTLRDGLVTRHVQYGDRESALRTAGAA